MTELPPLLVCRLLVVVDAFVTSVVYGPLEPVFHLPRNLLWQWPDTFHAFRVYFY